MTDAYFEAWRGGVVDTMIGTPATAEQRKREHYDRFASQILHKEAREQFTFPAQYMFKDVPDFDKDRGLIIMAPWGKDKVDPVTGQAKPAYFLVRTGPFTPAAPS